MMKSTVKTNSIAAREKISKTLKEKWRDPKFREKMMDSMKDRKSPSATASQTQRDKISAAMKKKWKDKDYRKKTIQGMEKYRDSLPPKPDKPVVAKVASTIKIDGIVAVAPMKKSKKKKRKASKVTVSAGEGVKKKKKKRAVKKKKASAKSKVSLAKISKKKDGPVPVEASKETVKDDGDISRMRTERRDLYDLLYGDEGDSNDEEIEEEPGQAPGVLDLDLSQNEDDVPATEGGLSQFFSGTSDLDDDDLDDFDPYNLDDY